MNPSTKTERQEQPAQISAICGQSTPSCNVGRPLFVDLDGTLIKADLLHESALQFIKRAPWRIFILLYWLTAGGRARLKSELASRVVLQTDVLPFHVAFVEYLRQQSNAGRRLYLATASDQRLAEAVAARFGLFCDVLASDGKTNLKGQCKLDAIRQITRGEPFDYAGNGRADLPIWKESTNAIVVNATPRIAKEVRRYCLVENVFDDRPSAWRKWLRGIRSHQWLKNILIFVPVLTAHAFSLTSVGNALVGFLAFGLVASATYMLNDLLDITSDRVHPRKRERPFAAGNIPIIHGLAGMVSLLTAGIIIASSVSPAFLLVLLAYLVITLAYSTFFKTYVLIDVLLLASLYTIRIIAGAVAIDVSLSSWLLGFSIFVFFSLALVKRNSELASIAKVGGEATRGRDYRVTDYDILNSMGVSSGYLAVLILALFIDSEQVKQHYSHPQLLWFLCPAMLYWLSRLWLKTARGEMHDDPLIYSLRDRGSWIIILSMAMITLLAI